MNQATNHRETAQFYDTKGFRHSVLAMSGPGALDVSGRHAGKFLRGAGQLDLRDLSARDMEPWADSSVASAQPHGFPTPTQPQGPQTGGAIFLHTGWRSGGTWIWSRCRAASLACGFYEPLHEQAAKFRRRDLARMRPGSWRSNHSDTAPYFEEFRDLIPPGGRGVAQYRSRFAFDEFFRAPDEPSDLELETYLGMLTAQAQARGKMPVLKFCRSMGRVGWLENMFPQALHLVVLRDPLTQFHSTQRLLVQQRNRYFALAPLVVLARNAQHPAVRDAAGRLGVSLPPLWSADLDYSFETCWRHFRRIKADERYRGFLAFWTLCAASALQSEAPVVDIDTIGTDLAGRLSVEAALRARIGETVRLVPRATQTEGAGALAEPPGMPDAHAAALALLRARGSRLSADRLDYLLAKLQAGPGRRAASSGAPRWSSPAPPPIARRSALQRLVTGMQVALARMVQPLRRLHGAVVWQQKAARNKKLSFLP